MKNSSFNSGRRQSDSQIIHVVHLSPHSCGHKTKAGNLDWFMCFVLKKKKKKGKKDHAVEPKFSGSSEVKQSGNHHRCM